MWELFAPITTNIRAQQGRLIRSATREIHRIATRTEEAQHTIQRAEEEGKGVLESPSLIRLSLTIREEVPAPCDHGLLWVHEGYHVLLSALSRGSIGIFES